MASLSTADDIIANHFCNVIIAKMIWRDYVQGMYNMIFYVTN